AARSAGVRSDGQRPARRSCRSRNPIQPGVGGKLGFYRVFSHRIFFRGYVTGNSVGEADECGFHAVDDLSTAEAGLAAQRVDSLSSGLRALVAEFLATDAEHLSHELTIHVVTHGDVVQNGAIAQSFLRGTADLARRARD